MIKNIFRDKDFYKSMISIALPISLQNLISSSLNMIDTVMIGQLGETNITAVGLANQVFFFLVLLLFGLNSGSAIFTSQFWGKKDIVNIRRVLGLAVLSGGILSLIFTTLALFFPENILGIFSNDPTVIKLGKDYLSIISFSYIMTAVTFAYSFASRSIGHAKLPMVVSSISLGINTILNWILIFGNLGFPQLGVKGAAIATLISRTVELVLLTTIIYRKGHVLAAKLNEMFDLSKGFIIRVFKTTTPVILNEAFWSLGIITYSAVYGRISTEAFASVQISNTVQQVFMVVSMGIGNACAVMIGNAIGANKNDLSIYYAKKYSMITPIVGIIIGLFIVVFSPVILGVFDVSDTVINNAEKILIIFAVFMAFKVFNITLVIGILRGGGDTKFSLFLEAGSVWFIGVPLAIIGGHILNLPVYLVVALVSLEEFVKALIGIPRVISKKWVRNVIEDI